MQPENKQDGDNDSMSISFMSPHSLEARHQTADELSRLETYSVEQESVDDYIAGLLIKPAPVSLSQFIDDHLNYDLYKQTVASGGTLGSQYSFNRWSFLICHTFMERALYNVVPKA